MEENLSLPELEVILEAARDQQHARNKFMAALKGVDIDEGSESDSTFEEVETRAKAKISGMSQDEYEYADLGFGVETA